MGYPRFLPDYTVGTVTVTSGSRTVTGAGTLWQDGAGEFQIAGGDFLRVGQQRPVTIESCNSATGLTLVEPWPHATAAGTAYRVIRYVLAPSSQVLAAINRILPLLENGWVTPEKLSQGAPPWDTAGNLSVLSNLSVSGSATATQYQFSNPQFGMAFAGSKAVQLNFGASNFLLLESGGADPTSGFMGVFFDGSPKFVVRQSGAMQGDGSGLTGVSDPRAKDDIRPITAAEAESVVMAVHPVSFILRDPPPDLPAGRKRGFLTTDLQPIMPEMVWGEAGAVDKDGNPIMQKMPLDKTAMISTLWAHVQALTERVRVLEAGQP
jgi:hypothetical protein